MDWLNQFHFIRPWFLLAIPVAAALLWFRHPSRQQQDDLLVFCDPHLMPALIDADNSQTGLQKHYLANVAILALFSFLGLGMAGPTWDKQAIPLLEPQNARVVVLGLAPSMRKSDIAPSRFERAKFKTMDLIRSSPELLQALVIYSGDAFVVSPLSDDHNTLLNLLKAVELDTVPTTGNRADKGLTLAAQLLDQPSLSYREIVLVTDTASPLTLSIAQQLSTTGVAISLLSINVEKSSNVEVLKAIARTGNGAFTHLRAGGQDIESLNTKMRRSSLLNLKQRQQSLDQFGAEEYLDKGVWLLILALIMAPFLFRKGWLASLVLLPLWFMPPPVYAFEWQDLWQRQDQQAAKLYQQQKFDQAQLKKAKSWQGAAAYRSQDYAGAVTYFGGVKDAESHYNAGNAHAQSGEFKAALAAYDQAIEWDTDHADAKHNRAIINKILAQQQSQQQQGEQDSEQDQEGQEGQEGQQSEQGKEQEGQNQQGKEQEGQSQAGQPEPEPAQDTPSQDTAEQEQKDQQTASEKDGEAEQQNQQNEMQAQLEPLKSEDQQALEQWLRKLPDDPGALLKRKFKVQHQQRQQSAQQ